MKSIEDEILCGVARQNCILMLQAKLYLRPEYMAEVCRFVSTMCGKHSKEECTRQSQTCREASEALKNGDTEKFRELCQYACLTCPYNVHADAMKERTLQ
ncbi:MAG TPA: hypothetical protein PK544_01705 [Spirochaetota bacterium]|nr:hypothetical protein [Spirochaetota bacterium]HPJ38053.1 hypothetical protein [Spirochaetota bacterium]HPQ51820.1 hypothetical protein [Spirochaetota bacterium]